MVNNGKTGGQEDDGDNVLDRVITRSLSDVPTIEQNPFHDALLDAYESLDDLQSLKRFFPDDKEFDEKLSSFEDKIKKLKNLDPKDTKLQKEYALAVRNFVAQMDLAARVTENELTRKFTDRITQVNKQLDELSEQTRTDFPKDDWQLFTDTAKSAIALLKQKRFEEADQALTSLETIAKEGRAKAERVAFDKQADKVDEQLRNLLKHRSAEHVQQERNKAIELCGKADTQFELGNYDGAKTLLQEAASALEDGARHADRYAECNSRLADAKRILSALVLSGIDGELCEKTDQALKDAKTAADERRYDDASKLIDDIDAVKKRIQQRYVGSREKLLEDLKKPAKGAGSTPTTPPEEIKAAEELLAEIKVRIESGQWAQAVIDGKRLETSIVRMRKIAERRRTYLEARVATMKLINSIGSRDPFTERVSGLMKRVMQANELAKSQRFDEATAALKELDMACEALQKLASQAKKFDEEFKGARQDFESLRKTESATELEFQLMRVANLLNAACAAVGSKETVLL